VGEAQFANGAGSAQRARWDWLRCSGERAAWVFRYTSATGKRRATGFGGCVRNNVRTAGESLPLARDLAAKQRTLLASDPRGARRSGSAGRKGSRSEQRSPA
jgi:hypothetical protein